MRCLPLVAILVVPSLAVAAPKRHPAEGAAGTGPISNTPSACGVKILPLVVGNEWTYSAVVAPAAPDDKVKRISPAQPKTIVITVKSIDAHKGAETVITLDEKITIDLTKDDKKPQLDEHSITTTITCDGKKLEISPDSFLFAGEPGGYYNLTLDKIERPKGTSWQLTNGGVGEAEWREDLIFQWKETPTPGSDAKLGAGKLELERRFTPQQPEMIVTKLGSFRAEKLGLITTGRVTLDATPEVWGPAAAAIITADAKPMELPAGWISTLWLAEGTGLVQSLNSFGHMYQLTDAKLK